ncbi:MAG: peroxiredoxin family protein, partial [Flavobacteriales bacterium]
RSFLEQKVTAFKNDVDSLIASCNNPFAIQYLQYATLQTSMQLEQANNSEIEFTIGNMGEAHPEGVALLSTFYRPRMNKVQMGELHTELLKSINKLHSPDSLIAVVRSMPFVTQKNQDLVLLVVLQQAINHPEIIRKNAIRTLFELSESDYSLATEAKAMLDQFMLGKKGQPLPEFKLLTLSEDFLDHSDFEEDWLFIGFFDSRSAASQVELKMMDELRKKYGRQIKFLAIFIDEDISSVKEFLSGKDFDFDLVFAGGNPTLLQGFKVKSTPEFLLFTPESTLYSSYTRKPSEGVEDDFKRVLRQKQRQPIKVWDD